jgi:hypothetical protein
MTYRPHPIDTAGITLGDDLEMQVERLAANNHDVWASERIDEGWKYGPARDDEAKTHPDLVPYEDLDESEKDYDRRSVRVTLKALIALGYRIEKR